MLEIFTTICGLIQSILILFKRKENWIFYLANIISLTIFSLSVHLYGDVLENLVYLIFGLLGLFTWYSDKISNKIFGEVNTIRYCNKKELLVYGIMFTVISISVYFWLLNTNDPLPLLDAVTTGMGFVATLMMSFKRVESWIVWFIDDILMAYTYYILPNPAIYLMILNMVWVLLAVGTFITWHKESKKGDING